MCIQTIELHKLGLYVAADRMCIAMYVIIVGGHGKIAFHDVIQQDRGASGSALTSKITLYVKHISIGNHRSHQHYYIACGFE